MSIQLHDLHHACLRVLDIDEAAARWSIQFGLTIVAKERGRALLACDSEDYCLELVEDRVGGALAYGKATVRAIWRLADG